MASIVLSSVGTSAGSSLVGSTGSGLFGGTLGKTLGSSVGGLIGGAIDDALFGVPTKHYEGPRLGDLSVQVSTYGKVIPQLFGSVRIAGNVVWSRPIRETATTSTQSSGGGKGSGGGTRVSQTSYSYSVSLAIAICAGEIDEVVRVWADAKQLDTSLGNYRVYTGADDQLPDPLIEGFEGIGSTPAYRGMAYVVIEDFPLADYGNRIPNFTFEVRKRVRPVDYQDQAAEEMVRGMVLIPAAGEFVYDTQVQEHVYGYYQGNGWVQKGYRLPVNMHTPNQKANVLVALDQLQAACPNLEWVSVVVSWFGTSLDAGGCTIQPGVEFSEGGTTEPSAWNVAGVSRSNAYQISSDVEGNINYGGTPDDASLVRLVTELRNRGLKVMVLPMFFMDVADKPWRGRVTGSAADVASFFTKTQGYNAFINHYAQLLAGKVDAFAIGSELVGLNKVTSSAGVYPAVDALVGLAASVRGIMGASSVTQLTYAADWSEYHHTDGGWYHLDPLWASPNIDVVGIDAYFPLTNESQRDLGYDIDVIKAGWDSGEGYDWVFDDGTRTSQSTIAPAYAWKNLSWWWDNAHVNPNAAPTAWVPQSKPVWFTEYGFPSVDGATNQPNVFHDPNSSESHFPYHSRGQIDFRAQRAGIVATEARWKDSPMVQNRFLWTWDARPYPYYPDLRSVWSDGGVWATGHWVTGKFGMSSLGALVVYLCEQAGLPFEMVDVSRLTHLVDGYVINSQKPVRALLEELMHAYQLDAVESDGLLRFVPRGNVVAASIQAEELVRDASLNHATLTITRAQEVEFPSVVNVVYLSRLHAYQSRVVTARRSAAPGQGVRTINLSLVMTESQARQVAEIALYGAWTGRQSYRFMLDDRYAHLEPADVVEIITEHGTHQMRITNMLRDRGRVRVDAVAESVELYDPAVYAESDEGAGVEVYQPLGTTELELLDIPALPADDADGVSLRVAVAGNSPQWRGAVIYRSDDGGANYSSLAVIEEAAVMGHAITELSAFTENLLDAANSVDVLLLGSGELESVSTETLLAGGNAALIGDEIVQFKTAEVLGDGHYRLSGLLRMRLGSDAVVNNHAVGERFVLLDSRVEKLSMVPDSIGREQLYKAVSIGSTLGATEPVSVSYAARCAKPYAPVHVRAERNVDGDVSLVWVRRTRVGGSWRDGVDVPLSERAENYVVELLNGADEVVDMQEVSSPELSYVAAQQLAVFGVLQGALHVRIYQLSETVGRGYVADVIV